MAFHHRHIPALFVTYLSLCLWYHHVVFFAVPPHILCLSHSLIHCLLSSSIFFSLISAHMKSCSQPSSQGEYTSSAPIHSTFQLCAVLALCTFRSKLRSSLVSAPLQVTRLYVGSLKKSSHLWPPYVVFMHRCGSCLSGFCRTFVISWWSFVWLRLLSVTLSSSCTSVWYGGTDCWCCVTVVGGHSAIMSGRKKCAGSHMLLSESCPLTSSSVCSMALCTWH